LKEIVLAEIQEGGELDFKIFFKKLVDLLRNSNSFNKLDLYWLYWARQ